MSTNNELIEYVRSIDPTFRWERLGSRSERDGALFDVRLVSQTWQGRAWEHRLSLFIPDRLTVPEWALLTVGSDSPGNAELTHLDFDLAGHLGIVCAHLYDIPNQPLFDDLREDELLAHTLTRYLDTEDATWPLLFPMVKAAVRALDTIAAICGQESGTSPTRFAVHGASKRGWTSWLAAVVDARVGAIMPEVYDNLNLFAQMPHQMKVWDSYSEMIDEYTEQRLQDKMRTPRGHHLALLVDPYTYRKQLTLPKLLIHGTNDRYWATDALTLYWDDLPGDKYIHYAPNQGHHIADRSRVQPIMAAFLRAVINNRRLPDLAASFDETDTALKLDLRAGDKALEARVWTAASANQDFRVADWTPRPLTASDGGRIFTGAVSRPPSGHLAIVAECLFPAESGPYLLSTQMYVLGSTRD